MDVLWISCKVLICEIRNWMLFFPHIDWTAVNFQTNTDLSQLKSTLLTLKVHIHGVFTLSFVRKILELKIFLFLTPFRIIIVQEFGDLHCSLHRKQCFSILLILYWQKRCWWAKWCLKKRIAKMHLWHFGLQI